MNDKINTTQISQGTVTSIMIQNIWKLINTTQISQGTVTRLIKAIH